MRSLLPPSTRLGPYEIIAPLGAGGMGEVYRARDTRLRREVAVKVLPQQFAGDANRLARFEREAKAVAALSHPNILVLHDVGNDAGVPYVVTELLEGETLQARLRGGPLAWEEAAEIAGAVASGLAAAHGKGIIHRDLKPGNLFLTNDGRVKVLDFGLARVGGELSGTADARPVTTLSEPGYVMGTAGYMSPEQICGETVDGRSDLFSLGCVLYEMASGQSPFARKTAAETLTAILHDHPPALAASLSPAAEQVIYRCLEKRREERFQTAQDLAGALRGHQTASRAGLPAPAGGGRRFGLVVAAGLALVVLSLIGALLVTQRRSGREAGEPGPLPASQIGSPGPVMESIAILPFINRSGDPQAESTCDGVPRTIIRSFLEIPRLNVRPFTSVAHYAKQEAFDPREVGRQLDVEAVLAGSISAGEKTPQITVELVDARNNRSLWIQSYDLREDLLSLQDDILKEVSSKLGWQISPAQRARLARRPTRNTAAYLDYLEGLHAVHRWTVKDVQHGIDRLERAVARDPAFALAQACLSDAYLAAAYVFMEPRAAFEKARQAAADALKCDPLLAEAHAGMAAVKFHVDWDWAGAGKDFDEAFRLNPRCTFAYDYYAWYWIAQGQREKAVAALEKAVELEPRSDLYNADLAFVYQHCRRFDEAEKQARKTLEIHPNNSMAPWALALVFSHRDQNYAAAMKQMEVFLERDPERGDGYGALGWLCGVWGKPEKARAALADLDRLSKDFYVRGECRAWTYAGLGDKDQAFRWLNQVCDERSPGIIYFKLDPMFESLRDDPRYAALLRRIGVAE